MGIGIKVEFGKGLVLEATKTDINRFVTALKAVETLILPIGTVHQKLGAAGKQAQAGLTEIIALLGGPPDEAAPAADAAPPVDEAAGLGETEVAAENEGEEVAYEDGEIGEQSQGEELADEPAAEGDDAIIDNVEGAEGAEGEEFAEFDDIEGLDGAMDLGDDEPAAEEATAPEPPKPAAKPAVKTAAPAAKTTTSQAAAPPSVASGLLDRKQALLAKRGAANK